MAYTAFGGGCSSHTHKCVDLAGFWDAFYILAAAAWEAVECLDEVNVVLESTGDTHPEDVKASSNVSALDQDRELISPE